jgi:hypothetical protein
MNETLCKKCGDICVIDGEYPEYFAWCYTCNNYAEWDEVGYVAQVFAGKIEIARWRLENRQNE